LIITKRFILYWNIAAARLDMLMSTLKRMEKEDHTSGKYFIRSDEIGLQAIDLENNKRLFRPYDAMEILSDSSLESLISGYVEEDAFGYIYPLRSFKEYLGPDPEEVSFDEILGIIKSKIPKFNNSE
jgi:hypothetical protein